MCNNTQVPAGLCGDLDRDFITIFYVEGDEILKVGAYIPRYEKVRVEMRPHLVVFSDPDYGGDGRILDSISLDKVAEIHIEESDSAAHDGIKTVSRWLRSPDSRLLRGSV